MEKIAEENVQSGNNFIPELVCHDCNKSSHNDPTVMFRMEYMFPICDKCYNRRREEIEMRERFENPEKYLIGTGVEDAEISFSFDNFDKDFEKLDEVKEYPKLNKLHDLILSGPCGSGKTHLAISIMRELVKRGCNSSKMHYWLEGRMHKKLLKHVKDANDFDYVFETICNYPFLILDDLGRKAPTVTCVGYTVDIIDERQRRGNKTLITTNRILLMHYGGDGSIQDIYGDPLHDRLKMFKYIPVNLESYRGNVKR